MKTRTDVSFVPLGHSVLSPYVIVDDVAAAIAFAKTVFGAKEIAIYHRPGGGVRHAEIAIADGVVMLSEGSDHARSSPAMLHVYVEDVDATFERALASGGSAVMAPTNQFYGDRNGGVDAFGIRWWLATHVEDVSNEEIRRRTAEDDASTKG